MNKKINLILIIILGIGILSTVGMATAKTVKYEDWCTDDYSDDYTDIPKHKTTWIKDYDYKTFDKIVKKDGKYQKRYSVDYITEMNCSHKCHGYYGGYDYEWFYGYEYEPCKKGDVIKKSKIKYYKTIEKEGKVINYYNYKKTYMATNTKTKTVNAKSKKITAYYKTIKVPTLKNGQSKKNQSRKI